MGTITISRAEYDAKAEAIAHIMTQEFVMASPLYRQEQEWARQGLKLSRQAMSNWALRAAEDHLLPVYEELRRQLVNREVLHAGETTLQALHEPGKKELYRPCSTISNRKGYKQ